MKKLIALISFLLLVTICSWSQELDNENFVITHGPWLQNMNQSGVTVIWTTNKPAVPGIIITNPDGTKRFIRNSHDGIIDGGGTLHKVRVEGLTPGSEYRYNLHSVQILKYQAYKVYYGDTLVTRSVNLSMPVLKSDKVSFTVFNDVHELSGKMGSYLRHNKTGNQDFWIFNGDMINYLQEEEQLFPGFIDTASAYFAASKPFYYVRGNHETRGYSIRELKKWFDFKDDKFYYSFDRGPVHFIILDSGEDKQDNSKSYFGLADYDDYRFKELEWLKEDVKSAAFQKAAYRIVMVHMPILKEEKQVWGIKFIADNFGPVLQNAGIDLLISAHTHRNSFYEKGKSGFGYPVLVNSNNSFVEVVVDSNGIKAEVKDQGGIILSDYQIK